ncbi:DNA replication and repair protein RecF [Thiogranum longum]|uniref:DNA replication and repair protein RecF n=1 Tax=Thiogranum longum TaxID=1537524 RepID=A0A4R1H8W4_9GAMM|nr:DNA replication/repair protein RecF [Thiogranum longum]TCK16893.1 DNA replication and repair protein RecF [Thiogranum longum]
MPLSSLTIEGFRNLDSMTLSFSTGVNLFSGQNAAGKTSLLEAIYVLGRARSFRSSSLDRAIAHGQEEFQLVAKLQQETNRLVPVGISRKPGKLMARINGMPARRLSELATLFPLQWVGGNLHGLIENGPPLRRQFLDWGLFHVKHEYIQAWKQFQTSLKQRNAALRAASSPKEVSIWDRDMVLCGEQLDVHRSDYLGKVKIYLIEIMNDFIDESESLDVHYRRGWSADKEYGTALKESLLADREQGYTRTGPQRADFTFKYRGKPVNEALSRGQQKLLIIGLKLAQASLLKDMTEIPSLFLLDDLGAELDVQNQEKVMRRLAGLDAQVFATAIEFPGATNVTGKVNRMFHVKHGKVSEVV